jgi:hypothetical protein
VRMPAHCAGCGARVELSIGERTVPYSDPWDAIVYPTQWVDPGTHTKHACKANVRSVESGAEKSAPRAVRPAGELANPDETGASNVKPRTPVKNRAKRAC